LRTAERASGPIAAFGLAVLLALNATLALGQGGLRERDAVQGEPREIGPVARAQIEALIAEKEARTPAQKKIDSRVLLSIDAARPTPRRAILKSLVKPLPEADGRIVVDIDLTDGKEVNHVIAVLRQVNAQVLFASERFKSIRARIQPQAVETIATISGVRFINSERQASHNKKHDLARRRRAQGEPGSLDDGYTGNGVKVCVLSDGINSLASRQATGDLPQIVDVLPGQAGSGDEGTALLEILYDLVPEARLGFATSNGGEAAFAQNILDLANAAKGGCKVIVDDTDYFGESPFQDGIVAQAVNTAIASGVVYVSSASNSGNYDNGTAGTWEGDFRAPSNMTSSLIPGHVLHEFAPGVAGNAALTPSSHVTLHWAEPNGGGGKRLRRLRARLVDEHGARIVDQHPERLPAPCEIINAPNGSSFPAGSRVVVAKKVGAPDRMFSVQWYRGRLTYATPVPRAATRAAADAISVAATPAAAAAGPTPPVLDGSVPESVLVVGEGRTVQRGRAAPHLLRRQRQPASRRAGGQLHLERRRRAQQARPDGRRRRVDRYAGLRPVLRHVGGGAARGGSGGDAQAGISELDVQQIKSALIASALDIQAPGWDRTSGAVHRDAARRAAGERRAGFRRDHAGQRRCNRNPRQQQRHAGQRRRLAIHDHAGQQWRRLRDQCQRHADFEHAGRRDHFRHPRATAPSRSTAARRTSRPRRSASAWPTCLAASNSISSCA
jgi:hypothetical protein